MTPALAAYLQALATRCEEATKGPWTDEWDYGFVNDPSEERICQFWGKGEEDFSNARANSRFIAHARTDLPRLLAAVRVLREAAARAYAECEWEFNQRGSWGPLSNDAVEALRAALARAEKLVKEGG